jgi:hypothetical protein
MRKKHPPTAPSEEEQQLDYTIFLVLLGEEGRAQFLKYLRSRRDRQEREESNAHEQPSA